jgi:type 1 fimbria pilin
MDKKEFLDLTKYYLKTRDVPEEEIKEILEDFEEHFQIGFEEGRTEEEICDSLGDPKEISKNYESNRKPQVLYYNKSEIMNKNFELDNIKTITYELNVGSVEVYPSQDNKIHVELLVDSEDYVNEASAKVDGDLLNIKVDINIKGMIFHQKCVLRLLIPKSKEINIIGKVVTGSIDIADINTHHISSVVKTGEVKAVNIVSNSFLADVNTGSIKMKNIQSNIRSTLKAGDINGENISASEIVDLKLHAGDIKLKGIYSDLNVELKMGDFELEDSYYRKNGEVTVKTGGIKYITGEKSEGFIEAETKIGSVKIKNSMNILNREKIFTKEFVKAKFEKGENKIKLSSKVGDIVIK